MRKRRGRPERALPWIASLLVEADQNEGKLFGKKELLHGNQAVAAYRVVQVVIEVPADDADQDTMRGCCTRGRSAAAVTGGVPVHCALHTLFDIFIRLAHQTEAKTTNLYHAAAKSFTI